MRKIIGTFLKVIGTVETIDVPVEQIKPSPYQPRLTFNLEDIRGSIQRDGILVPLTVRDRDGYYELIDGERRHLASIIGMKHNPQAITTAMRLYFSGESLRNTQKSLSLLGVEVSHQTIYNWIKKYIGLMENYIDKLRPRVSDTWRADELWMKFKGDMKYVFAIMDDETRYWIAQEVAESKYKHDARKLFQLAKKVTGKKPKTLITDGLPAYHDAYKKEFWTLKKETRTEHIRHIKIKGDMNNNKMERLNGEIRDREKVMRGLKKEDSPILKGYQIFHNYIREHKGLEGKTPAEECGIKIEGENKWLTLIQNASHFAETS